MNAAKIRQCLVKEKSEIVLQENSMGRPKIGRFKGTLPSIILFILVLIYISGYISFRSHVFDSSPRIADYSNLKESRARDAKFYSDWKNENEARFDWQALIATCSRLSRWQPTVEWWKKQNRTDPNKSYISLWEINPAGDYSRFFIQSQNVQSKPKSDGGDSWRVRICGPACLNPVVRDFGNGSYEVKFLAIEPGNYLAIIHLDYTLCDGIKDPPPDWFVKGNAQGKDQEQGILGRDIPYMKQPFWNNEPLEFHIPKSYLSKKSLAVRLQTACLLTQNRNCELLWNGLGRWADFQWKPFCNDTSFPRKPRRRKGYLWIFGDSTATRFHWSIHGKSLCHSIFKRCLYTYNWIYQIDNYNLTLNKFIRRNTNRTFLKKDDDNDFNADRIIHELKQVLYHPEMDEYSVVLLNYGLHFAEASNFSNFRTLIDKLAFFLKNETVYKPYVIWRSTTALNRHKYSVPYLHSRRFLTSQRVGLFNAYANSAMCHAGIPILDVFPLTNSYPNGTGNSISPFDPVHYDHHVLYSVEELLVKLFG